MHHSTPFPSHLDAYADLADRFWFWRGASGRQYIHSVYTPKTCPPLRGGVYLAVKRSGDLRQAIAVGLFHDVFDPETLELNGRAAGTADELHVHLLARRLADAEAVAKDLEAAVCSTLAVIPASRTCPGDSPSTAKARAA